jgi:CheY-like chemotaxis protein/HPt (histidine-containing phosphotransfer) domain-containing protein
MGGELEVESSPGAGSTFWFTLTLPRPDALSRPLWQPRADLQNVRVIVVDDNATNREILQQQLGSWGMQVTLAASGAEALMLLHQAVQAGKPYALALLDWHMPEMDGLELARHIRAEATLGSLRLLMLTSSGLDDTAAQAAAGIDRCLHKPVRQAALYEALRQLLGTTAEAEAVSAPAWRYTEKPHFNARILVAEDNPVNQEVAVAMLESLGCQVAVVANGREAVAAVTRARYDLILMDCHMPVLDGFAATLEIRRQEQADARPAVPIIALTANVIKGFREQCLAVGMNDYLSKPFTQAQLQTLLQQWLTHGSREESPTAAPTPTPLAAERVLDPEPLSQIRALQRPGAPSLLAKVIGVYLDNSPTLVQRLREAVAQGDAVALRETAHSLKSSSANLGAAQLATLCKELEQRGREQRIEGTAALLAEVQAKYSRVREALAVELAEDCATQPVANQPQGDHTRYASR